MIVRLEHLSAQDAPRWGAKAAHLGELIAAGLRVPEGFAIAPEAVAALAAGDAAVAEAVRAAYAALGTGTEPVAVRSSALGEDGAEASFAGTQTTVLNVRGPEPVIEAIQRCHAGLGAERAEAYRARLAPEAAGALAVVVQRLVPAACAGVAFSADPITGDRNAVVIDASWGLGEAVVSGRVTPDHIVADPHSGDIRHYQRGDKAVAVVPHEAGVALAQVPPEARAAAALRAEDVQALVAVVRQAAERFGGPQDLEWAIADGALYVLQARPITALPPPPPETGWAGPVAGAVWERRNVAEHFPGPVSPLAETLLLPAIAAQLPPLAAEVGYRLAAPALTAIHGYVYARGDLRPFWWMPLAAARHALEILTGAPARWERGEGHRARLDRLLALEPDTPEALIRWCEAYASELARTWVDVHRLSAGWRWSEYALRRALGGDMLTAGRMLGGYDVPALGVEARLGTLAAAPAGSEAAQRLLESILAAGAHMPASLDPAVPLPFGEAERVCRLAASRPAEHDPARRQLAAAHARDRAVSEALAAASPLERLWLVRVIRWAQGYAAQREPALAALGYGWGAFQARLSALAECLGLAAPEEVFWLHWDEARAMASGGAGPGAEVLAERRERQALRAGYTPPLSVGTGPLCRDRTIGGVPASPGRATGRARVIRGPEEFETLQPGEILIAPATTPAWTPLFHRAAAIVTDVGGPLSHGSIVAREFGIPAVLGAESATRRLRTGQLVTVDGDHGLVWPHR